MLTSSRLENSCGLEVQRQMPDMKYNKAKWIGPCKVVSVLDGGLFELFYEVNGEFIKYNLSIHSSLSGFVENFF